MPQGRPRKEQRFEPFTNCEQELCDIVNEYNSSPLTEYKKRTEVSRKLKTYSKIGSDEEGKELKPGANICSQYLYDMYRVISLHPDVKDLEIKGHPVSSYKNHNPANNGELFDKKKTYIAQGHGLTLLVVEICKKLESLEPKPWPSKNDDKLVHLLTGKPILPPSPPSSPKSPKPIPKDEAIPLLLPPSPAAATPVEATPADFVTTSSSPFADMLENIESARKRRKTHLMNKAEDSGVENAAQTNVGAAGHCYR